MPSHVRLIVKNARGYYTGPQAYLMLEAACKIETFVWPPEILQLSHWQRAITLYRIRRPKNIRAVFVRENRNTPVKASVYVHLVRSGMTYNTLTVEPEAAAPARGPADTMADIFGEAQARANERELQREIYRANEARLRRMYEEARNTLR